jgi:4'-phosphopantetheinyl transferase
MCTDNLLCDSVQCTVLEIGQKEILTACEFPPVLEKNSIHVWSARYGDLERHFGILSDVISQKEQETASTFRKSADAKKYVIRRGIVRSILAYYTHHSPEKIVFISGENGKPELFPDTDTAELSFNLSHSGERVLIGVTKKRRIGVDIVRMNPSYRFQDTGEFLMTPAEKVFLERTEPAQRYQVFFRIWASKEAIIKATGGTLTQMGTTDLSEIIEDILYSPDYSMHCLSTHLPFFLWQFTDGSGHLGAIAIDVGKDS